MLHNNGSLILASHGHVTLRLQQVLNPVLINSNFSYMNDTEILTLFFTIDNSGKESNPQTQGLHLNHSRN